MTASATTSTDLGNNANWNFGSNSLAWVGGTSANWNTASNWNPGYVPNASDLITVGAGTPNNPSLASNVTVASLTINAPRVLDLVTYNFTVGGALTVNAGGRLRLQGGQTVSAGAASFPGIVEYYGTAGYAGLATGIAGVSYGTLQFTAAGTWTLNAGPLNLTGPLSLSSGAHPQSQQQQSLRGGGSFGNGDNHGQRLGGHQRRGKLECFHLHARHEHGDLHGDSAGRAHVHGDQQLAELRNRGAECGRQNVSAGHWGHGHSQHFFRADTDGGNVERQR